MATTVTITDNENTDEDNAIIFAAGGDVDGGNLGLESDGTLTYNPSTGKVTATGFIGNLTGNASGNAATATLASTVTVTDSTANTDFPIVFHNESNGLLDDTGSFTYNASSGDMVIKGGNLKIKNSGGITNLSISTAGHIITDNKIGTATDQEYINFSTSNEINTFINNTERLSVTSSGVSITGDLTVSGSYNLASGDIPDNGADTTGSAASLKTARNINGVSFNGTSDITINASGSTLSDIVPVSKGGTNTTSFADKSVIITQDSGTDTLAAAAMSSNGQLLIGGTSGPSVATLTAGSNISITNSDGGISIASTDVVGGLGGAYRDTTTTPNLLYKFLLPSDFLNDNDSSGYSRSVIADSGDHGSQQCYSGSQYYAFFTIPSGYHFSGFRVNLVNSSGTAVNSTPSSSIYVNIYSKTINSSLSTVGSTKGFNTNNTGYTINSGHSASWDINDPITICAVHCYNKNNWSSSFYNRGGWLQFTEGESGS